MLYCSDGLQDYFVADNPPSFEEKKKAPRAKGKTNLNAMPKISSEVMYKPYYIEESKGGEIMRVLKDVNKIGSIVLAIFAIFAYVGALSNQTFSLLGGTLLGTLCLISSIIFWKYSDKQESGC